MHKKVIEQILKIKADRIVYVSCNSATQARDIELMNTEYKVTNIQPIDMFPQTHHVENIVVLEWQQDSIMSPSRPGNNIPKEIMEAGAKYRPFLESQHIEFYEMIDSE